MKKILILLTCFVFLMGLSWSVSAVAIDSPPVMILRMDEGSGRPVKDVSGYGNDGRLAKGSNTPTWVAGRHGSALDFDGDDFVEVQDDGTLDFDFSSFSIEAWIKTTDRYGTIVNKLKGIDCGTSDCDGFMLLVHDGVLALRIYDADVGNDFATWGTTKINDGEWHHVAAVVDWEIENAMLYVDGKSEDIILSGPLDNIDTPPVNDQPLYVGIIGPELFPEDDQYNYTGIIDEVQITRRALVAGEIEEDYESVPAVIDIKIKRNTLYLKSKEKWISAYIMLPPEYSIADIDTARILLERCMPAVEYDIEEGKLKVKFYRDDLETLLSPGNATLTVTGKLIDGTPFKGTDTITVVISK